MTTALLFSAGLDSLCLWHLTGQPVPVYVRTGHRYEAAELAALAALEDATLGLRVRVVDGPQIGPLEHPVTGHVPHRNLALLTTAAAATGADRLLLGALLGEASPDKSRRFLRAASRALTASEGRKITVEAPAHRWTKTGLVRRFAAAYPDAVPTLAVTRSCYEPAGECGTCPACFRRQVALWRAGLSAQRPQVPTRHGSALSAAWAAGVTRWPALAANNAGALLALYGPPPRRTR